MRGSTKCLWGPIFEGKKGILILGKAIKFRVIFQKYALKLIKLWYIIEKIWEKCIFFRCFYFSACTMGKIRKIIWTGYNRVRGQSSPKVEKFSRYLSVLSCKIKKLNQFTKILSIFWAGFGQKYKNNWKKVCAFPLNFSTCHFNFFRKFAGRPPGFKLIIHYIHYTTFITWL